MKFGDGARFRPPHYHPGVAAALLSLKFLSFRYLTNYAGRTSEFGCSSSMSPSTLDLFYSSAASTAGKMGVKCSKGDTSHDLNVIWGRCQISAPPLPPWSCCSPSIIEVSFLSLSDELRWQNFRIWLQLFDVSVDFGSLLFECGEHSWKNGNEVQQRRHITYICV